VLQKETTGREALHLSDPGCDPLPQSMVAQLMEPVCNMKKMKEDKILLKRTEDMVVKGEFPSNIDRTGRKPTAGIIVCKLGPKPLPLGRLF
jgi:hypothetical protein